MEIFEKQDPEKRRLMDEAKKHKDNLSNEVRLVSEKSEQLITNALIIGGTLALSYVLINAISGSKSKKKKSKTVKIVAQPASEKTDANNEDEYEDSILTQIGTKIANEATVFLLKFVKEKLNEYMQSTKNASNEDH